MQNYYSANPELRTSHILIELKPNANQQEHAAAKKRALEIHAEVKKSKRPFEELVALYTDDLITKKTGGDTGWQTPLTIVPEYYAGAAKLKIGQISPLIETKYGFHIVKLTGKNAYKDADKRVIRSAVMDQKKKKIFDNYFSKLKTKYSVKVNKGLIN